MTQVSRSSNVATLTSAGHTLSVGDQVSVSGTTGYNVTSVLTDVTAKTFSFDQTGNVWEWNEAFVTGSTRGLRGGSYFNAENFLRASKRNNNTPTNENNNVGFRVPSVPEPSIAVLMILLGATALLVRRRWRRELFGLDADDFAALFRDQRHKGTKLVGSLSFETIPNRLRGKTFPNFRVLGLDRFTLRCY